MAPPYQPRPVDGMVASDKHFGGHSHPDYDAVFKHDPEKGGSPVAAALAVPAPPPPPPPPPVVPNVGDDDAESAKRKRKAIIVLAIAVIIGVLLAIVLGVGLGVGLKSDDDPGSSTSSTDGGSLPGEGPGASPADPGTAEAPEEGSNVPTVRPARAPTPRPTRRPTAARRTLPPPAPTAPVCPDPAAVNYQTGDLLVLDVSSSTSETIDSYTQCCNACAAESPCNLFVFCNPGGSDTGCGPEKACSMFLTDEYDGLAGTPPACNSLGQWPKNTCSLKRIRDFSALKQYEGKDAAGWISGVFNATAS